MFDESPESHTDSEPLFDDYGQFVLLLDAEPQHLFEPIEGQDNESIRQIIGVLEDQINETPFKGNEELLKRHMFLWLFCIRQLDEGHAGEVESDTFKLNFKEWELQQFH